MISRSRLNKPLHVLHPFEMKELKICSTLVEPLNL